MGGTRPEIPVGHPNMGGVGFGVQAVRRRVAVSDDGQTLVVVNYYNDSISGILREA